MKKSDTEEEYGEREVLLEEIKALKESTIKIPRGKRALTQAILQEGQMLRESAAASISPAFVMREEIVVCCNFMNEQRSETPQSGSYSMIVGAL